MAQEQTNKDPQPPKGLHFTIRSGRKRVEISTGKAEIAVKSGRKRVNLG